MTAAEDIPNIILGTDGGVVTVNTEKVEKIYSKKIVAITPPQTSANWDSGPKDTKIVDLLRIELRFVVRGSINDGDQPALENLFNQGGVFNMTWDGTDFNIDMEKLSIAKDSKKENSEKDIMFTCIVGVNM